MIGIGFTIIFKKKDLDNTTDRENIVTEIISNTAPDEETPEKILYLNMSNEEKVKCCSMLGTFENGKELTTDQYLQVVYNALNSNIIGGNKNSYSEGEIKNIVYSIFNVELTENKSVDGLKYSNGIYEIERKEIKKYELENIESGVAAGNLYMVYKFDKSNYIAKLSTNGVTGENYVSSIVSNN